MMALALFLLPEMLHPQMWALPPSYSFWSLTSLSLWVFCSPLSEMATSLPQHFLVPAPALFFSLAFVISIVSVVFHLFILFIFCLPWYNENIHLWNTIHETEIHSVFWEKVRMFCFLWKSRTPAACFFWSWGSSSKTESLCGEGGSQRTETIEFQKMRKLWFITNKPCLVPEPTGEKKNTHFLQQSRSQERDLLNWDRREGR